MTLFLTTHYLEEAEPCDRVVIVDRGQVIAQGTPGELKRDLGGSECDRAGDERRPTRACSPTSPAAPAPSRAAPRPGDVAVDSAEAVLPMLLPLIGERLESLSVRRPTLDDVFVAAHPPGARRGAIRSAR